MTATYPTSNLPEVTRAERAQWAQVRADDARRLAQAYPDDRVYAMAAAARQREADAMRGRAA